MSLIIAPHDTIGCKAADNYPRSSGIKAYVMLAKVSLQKPPARTCCLYRNFCNKPVVTPQYGIIRDFTKQSLYASRVSPTRSHHPTRTSPKSATIRPQNISMPNLSHNHYVSIAHKSESPLISRTHPPSR